MRFRHRNRDRPLIMTIWFTYDTLGPQCYGPLHQHLVNVIARPSEEVEKLIR